VKDIHNNSSSSNKDWRKRLHEIIYEADTPAGKWFDLILLILIILSIILVMVESVEDIRVNHKQLIVTLEWIVTILFSLEYIARVVTINKPTSYIFSFYGIIDLLSTIPMYLSFLFVGANALVALRGLRLLRIFNDCPLKYRSASRMRFTSLILC